MVLIEETLHLMGSHSQVFAWKEDEASDPLVKENFMR